MKKIVLKLYEFDELSKDSQERIIERETNDNIMVVRIDKMDDVYRNDRPLDSGIGVVHSFRINNKIIKAVACQTVIRNDICSKCCFVDTNICSNMRCFSSVREDDKSVIFKKIEL